MKSPNRSAELPDGMVPDGGDGERGGETRLGAAKTAAKSRGRRVYSWTSSGKHSVIVSPYLLASKTV